MKPTLFSKLFLATAKVYTQSYMGRCEYENITRLVWADNYEEAEKKIEECYTRNDPYGTDIWVDDLELTEAL
jgi:hypothetical protein